MLRGFAVGFLLTSLVLVLGYIGTERKVVAPQVEPAAALVPPQSRLEPRLARELAVDCQRRLDALTHEYPLTFERRSAELRAESRPAVFGAIEISADCPHVQILVSGPLRDGGDELTLARLEGVARALREAGVAAAIGFDSDADGVRLRVATESGPL